MADCTVEQVLNDAQSWLGDPGGQITQQLVLYFYTAYSELYAALLKLNAQEAVREVYYTLPAYTGVIFPDMLGVSDFAEPQQLWERTPGQQIAIDTVTDGSPISVTTLAPIPFGSYAQVELNGVQGVPGWVNRDWFVTKTGDNSFTLNGSYLFGFGSATGGVVMQSSAQFTPMRNVDVMPLPEPPQNQFLGTWRWTENAIYVPGSTEARQIYIEYLADATAPVTGKIGLCEGRERQFLSYATAARFAMGARQMQVGPSLMMTAYGPTGEADGKGGLLREVLIPIWKQSQQLPRRMGLIRPRRTTAPVLG